MNLSDLSIITYSEKITDNKLITENEIRQALIRMLSEKISERFDIINNFFKLIKDFLIKTFIYLAQNYQN